MCVCVYVCVYVFVLFFKLLKKHFFHKYNNIQTEEKQRYNNEKQSKTYAQCVCVHTCACMHGKCVIYHYYKITFTNCATCHFQEARHLVGDHDLTANQRTYGVLAMTCKTQKDGAQLLKDMEVRVLPCVLTYDGGREKVGQKLSTYVFKLPRCM